MTEFNLSLALSLMESEDQFPVDFEDAWSWLSFARKDTGKKNFESCGFVEGVDFTRFRQIVKLEQGGNTYKEKILLTIECFKCWAMMSKTDQGKQVRQYFLECEKVAQKQTLQIANIQQTIEETVMKALNTQLEKVEKYEQSCLNHRGNGTVIQYDVERKQYPSETVTTSEYCHKKGIDRTMWNTFSRRYAQFVRVGAKQEPPKRKGKLLIYGELYFYAEVALKNTLDLD